jgi:alkylation response protein AidB-like acyl-CoA dehydrogenase
VALDLCRAAVTEVTTHLKTARFDDMGQTLGEARPTLRALLATMVIETDDLSVRIDDLIDHLERPRGTTLQRVLETKAAAGETAISVTSAAMRACGGAAFSKHNAVERLFRGAHVGAVMAPTATCFGNSSARRSWASHCSDTASTGQPVIAAFRGHVPPWRP